MKYIKCCGEIWNYSDIIEQKPLDWSKLHGGYAGCYGRREWYAVEQKRKRDELYKKFKVKITYPGENVNLDLYDVVLIKVGESIGTLKEFKIGGKVIYKIAKVSNSFKDFTRYWIKDYIGLLVDDNYLAKGFVKTFKSTDSWFADEERNKRIKYNGYYSHEFEYQIIKKMGDGEYIEIPTTIL